MKRFFKIILWILLALALVIGAGAYWQRENLRSLITSFRYSNEELAEKINTRKQELEKVVASYSGGVIRDFSHEEEEKIRRGELSVEEAMELAASRAFAPSLPSSSADPPPAKEGIAAHIETMYQLKAQYIGKLGALERQAAAEYKSLPREKRGAAGKQSMATKYMSEIAQLERECDAQVNEVLAGLKQEGADSELIKAVKKAYEDEKVLRKSYYINSYK